MEGLLPRWHINFNITMLRIVSFALDYHWRQTSNVTVSIQSLSWSLRPATGRLPETSLDFLTGGRVLAP
jgi:hypothetical protein